MSPLLLDLNSLVSSPIFLALAVAVLTALIAPYLIERTKANISRREKIVATQFEIIESLTVISSRYVTSAKFVVTDFSAAKVIRKDLETHRSNYEVTIEETLRNCQVQAYRARIYFADPKIYGMVMKIYEEIAAVDLAILQMVDQLDRGSMVIDEAMRSEADRVSNLIHNLNLGCERLLEFLFERTGKVPTRVKTDATIGTGKELPTR